MPDPLEEAAKRLDEIAKAAKEDQGREAIQEAARKLRGK